MRKESGGELEKKRMRQKREWKKSAYSENMRVEEHHDVGILTAN